MSSGVHPPWVPLQPSDETCATQIAGIASESLPLPRQTSIHANHAARFARRSSAAAPPAGPAPWPCMPTARARSRDGTEERVQGISRTAGRAQVFARRSGRARGASGGGRRLRYLPFSSNG
ncbi:hypothetical protein BS78_K259200 [Paspalum vaginatum]|uniref:Uncharacterized protein n=1 Tax=Paspalum vaginatum TaxID=158149 RepID=A0A9W8CG58_9POAL|nr:hypothetical protein BS78_K259200 [Paspalum vaginatum]